MATTIEYALLAGASYYDTRADINRFPVPQNWSVISRVPQDASTGFEASTYKNSLTNDIVISYAGTYDKDIFGDIAANIGLATGFGSDQLLQAAEYYLQVKAANPNANITFTGHSLGGGLAALMGVFFGKQAVTFDQAPFANSAELNLLTPDVAANLKNYLSTRLDSNGNRIYADAALSGLTNFLQLREINGGIPNSNLVSTIRVDGEFTSSLPVGLYDPIGTSATVLDHGPYFSPSIDMHSQALLTAFLQSQQSAANGQSLSEVTKKLTNLLGMIFDPNLFAYRTDDPDNRNLLEHLVRHEAGVQGAFAPDAMLTHFTNDMGDVAQAGGQALSNVNLNKSLIAFGLQAYYEQVNAFTKEAFESFGGGMRFDRAMIAGDLNVLKGYELYFLPYLEERFTGDTLSQIKTQLPSLQDWFIASGAGSAMVTASDQAAFMLGADKLDRFTGSSRSDLIVGDAGNDLLEGAEGDDTLVGGTGTDTYLYRAGDGLDTLLDTDGLGRIVYIDAQSQYQALSGGGRETGSDGVYQSSDGRILYSLVGATLSVTLDGVQALTLNDFQDGTLGIVLSEQPAIQISSSILGTPDGDVVSPTVSGDADLEGILGNDVLRGASGNDTLIGGAGDDWINGNRGNDTIDGGDGNDFIIVGPGYDVAKGGVGNDFLGVSARNEQLPFYDPDGNGPQASSLTQDDWRAYMQAWQWSASLRFDDSSGQIVGSVGWTFTGPQTPDNPNAVRGVDAIGYFDPTPDTTGDALFGGDGDDTLFGDVGNDELHGDAGNDSLIGADGDDTLEGGADNDVIAGGKGDDFIGGGPDTVTSGTDNDTLYGEEGDDLIFGGAGDDVIEGDFHSAYLTLDRHGNDILFGGSGNDALFGQGGNDYLDGEDGADQLVGDAGSDTVLGGTGNDQLFGDASTTAVANQGADLLYGEDGDDTLQGYGGDDWLDGGNDNDTLFGLDGNDTLIGGNGADQLVGGNGADILEGGPGNDTLYRDALDTLVFNVGDGQDQATYVTGGALALSDFALDQLQISNVTGGDGYQYLRLDFGNGDALSIQGGFLSADQTYDIGAETLNQQQLMTYAPSLSLTGTSGADTIYGGNQNDYLYGYTGTPTSADGNDTLYGQGGNDALYGGVGNDQLYGGEGVDQLYGHAGNDTLDGGAGNDLLVGADGSDTLDGANGADTMVGGTGNDLLDGGAGDDRLFGDSGSDIFVFGRGYGQDTIGVGTKLLGDVDTLRFAPDILPVDITITRDASNNYFSINGTGDRLTVTIDPNVGFNTIDRFEFADGTVWDTATVDNNIYIPPATEGNDVRHGSSRSDTLLGLGGNDLLSGYRGDDTIDGGAGNDSLVGGVGNDTYIFGRGYGSDMIFDGGMASDIDTVRFGPDIVLSDLAVTRDSNNVYVRLVGNNKDDLTVGGWWSDGTDQGGGIERAELADGTVFDLLSLIQAPRGTASNDVLLAGDANDVLAGGPGDDALYAEGGNDILVGGSGQDSLLGGKGGDVYLFNRGDGVIGVNGFSQREYLYDTYAPDAGDIDTLSFGRSISPTDIDAYLQYDDYGNGVYSSELMLRDRSTGETIWLGWWQPWRDGNGQLTAGDARIERVQFLGSGDDRAFDLIGIVNARFAELTAASDTSPVSLFTPEMLAQFDITAQVGLAGGQYAIDYANNQAPLLSNPIADQNTAADAAFAFQVPSNTFTDSDAGDALTYTATLADGSALPAWLSFDAATRSFSGTPGNGDADSFSVRVRVSDTSWANAFDDFNLTVTNVLGAGDIIGTAGNDTPNGTGSADRLFGLGGNDQIYGNAGNDSLYGGGDNDSLDGGSGSDALYGGRGNDFLFGGLGDDILDGGPGRDFLSGGPGNDTYIVDRFDDIVADVYGNDSRIDTIFSSVSYGLPIYVENLTLTGSANINAFGNELNNVLTGNAGNNRLGPGIGTDYLYGGAGDDEYEIGRGTGGKFISDVSGNDTIVFGDGMWGAGRVPNFVVSRQGNVLVIADDLGGGVSILDWYMGQRIETFRFWNRPDIVLSAAYIEALAGGTGGNNPPSVANPIADQTTAEDAAFSFQVPANSFTDPDAGDTLGYTATLASGDALPAWLVFNPTSQTFTGTPTNNNVGSMGINVTATDGSGASVSDVFTLAVTNVNDAPVITVPTADQIATEGAAFSLGTAAGFTDDDFIHGDTLTYAATLTDGSALPAWLTFDAATSTFSGTAPTDSILIGTDGDDVLVDTDTGIAGTWNIKVSATDTADVSVLDNFTLTLQGVPGNDTLLGFGGNDVLNGGAGNDTLNGGTGNDILLGGTGNDTYVFNLGDGIDTIIDFLASGETTTLVFGVGIDANSISLGLGSLLIHFGGQGDAIHIAGLNPDDVFATPLIDLIRFDDGTTLDLNQLLVLGFDINGADGNDTLTGTNATDRITGGQGNDVLNGGASNDTYLYNPGDGLDQLTDTSGTDTVSFGTGYSFDNTVIRTEGNVAHLRFLDTDGNETTQGIDLTLNPDGSSPVETFAFANGTTSTLNDLLITNQTWYGDKKANTIITGRNDDTVYAGKGGDTVYGRTGNDTLYGEKDNDKLYGEGGNDSLYGGKGDDTLNGGAGNDYLNGGEGKNTLIGGKGNDTLILGKGEDTIRFNHGDGWDTLKSTTKDPEDSDIKFGAGITQQNLWFSRTGNDLTINILNTQDGMTIENWFTNKHKPIEEFKTANGDELAAKQVGLLVQAMAGFTPVPGTGGVLPTEMPDELQATLAAAWDN